MLRNKLLFIVMILLLVLLPGVSILAQESTQEPAVSVEVPLADQVDSAYSATNNLIDNVIGAMPLLALIVALGAFAYTFISGKNAADAFGDELLLIRNTKIFSDAERSYERIQTPTSDMSINVAIAFLRATIMLPIIPRAMEDGLVSVVRLLEDLQDGPDGDEPVT